ncbi:MAG TPA: alanine racemase [Terriglobales bacterium]|nr:alanine racemase [Terriglobales bacterium]
MPPSLDQLPTPCLLLDRERLERNCARLRDRMAGLGASLRPHLKTCKSRPVAELMLAGGNGSATVSTLREAEEFAACGVRDLIYAVGIAPAKLDRVARMRAAGVDLAVILDSVEQAEALAARARSGEAPIPALIEIDADGHRAGIRPERREQLLAVARALPQDGLRGVLTHAGDSYHAHGVAALEQAAEQERAAAANAAATLRASGFACPVVSVGSTPTAHFARNLAGVSEVRAGVYCFFDLVMAGLGVCGLDDIACTVLATVIGHQPEKGPLGGWTLTDAGWMALSRDRGDGQSGYGLVCDEAGRPYENWLVTETSQEHGVLALRPGARTPPPRLAVGARVRILPNHICATAAQFDSYFVLDRMTGVMAEWPRFRGF